MRIGRGTGGMRSARRRIIGALALWGSVLFEAPAYGTGMPLDLGVEMAGAYSTNINRTREPAGSYGVVSRLWAGYAFFLPHARLDAEYAVARHEYSRAKEWERTSNELSLAVSSRPGARWRLRALAGVSFKGPSDELDVSNWTFLTPSLEYRLRRDISLQLYGTFKYQWFAEAAGTSAIKPHVGLRFQQAFANRQRLRLGGRWERNLSAARRSEYARWTYDAAYRLPRWGPLGRTEIELSARYRTRAYDARLIRDAGGDRVLRRDRRWLLAVDGTRPLGAGSALEVGYEFEKRRSNDQRRRYAAQALTVRLRTLLYR